MKKNSLVFLFLIIFLYGCMASNNKSVIPASTDPAIGGFSKENRVEIKSPPLDAIVIDDSAEFISYAGGKLYKEISRNFDIVVYPVKITYDEEKHQCIDYAFNVFNKTEKIYRNFEAILRLDNGMEKYIHSGTIVFPPQRMDLYPKNQIKSESDVWGINVAHSSVIFQPSEMKELGIVRKDMIPIAGIMKLQLEWDDGSEYYEFCVDVIDEME